MRIIFGFTNFNIIQSVTSAHIQISLFRLNYLNIFINRINNLGVNGHRYSRSWENKSLPMDERCLKTFHLYNTVAQAHSSQTQNKRLAACLRITHRNQIFYPGKLITCWQQHWYAQKHRILGSPAFFRQNSLLMIESPHPPQRPVFHCVSCSSVWIRPAVWFLPVLQLATGNPGGHWSVCRSGVRSGSD